MTTAADVLNGSARWSCETADVLAWLDQLPDDSVDLLVTSPPYELARTYGIGEKMVGGQAWVDWMVGVVRAASPKVKGLIAINCEGQTRNYRYSCVPFLLVADLHRAGFNLRKPPAFHRVGIPGSGGPDWLRNDYEPIICVTRPGRLPWSDNTACGHPPKWAPGGEMSHRLTDGTKRNQFGMNGTQNRRNEKGVRETMNARFRHAKDGTVKGEHARDINQADEAHGFLGYDAPALANPGNVIKCNVGGGVMGHELAHQNEAPFPLDLPAFFVKSFCPPDGIVCDPFTGSGTTAHAAIENGRRFIGCDVRESQADLTARRLATITPDLFSAGPTR